MPLGITACASVRFALWASHPFVGKYVADSPPIGQTRLDEGHED